MSERTRSVGESLPRANRVTRTAQRMSAPATHGQGRSICTPTKKPRPHARASQPQHKSHHNPTRRTVRPVDGQTRAKRTPGRVIARKRVRSPYSEPEREMRQACADHTWTNEAHNSHQRSLPYSRVRARARGQTHKKQWGAWHLETPDHAPHTITR